ncbi:GGDEF domain-containing protein [Microbulbifer hydrolyticus]|uniref:diguanylate cyclase n=1 Tax=Microbulbifer hydrolyticus TaxID=48074 RepID=A0A6P1TA69_9GAMM|nr:GGDEF domain-containing protein [Microbulbifer hydrolyticus]MBB5211997.1 diguanylate cyclase (GGDEF)-like protein [Microbulbifer hydrolyticus]QHQ39678.1 diguanylate cyclase [Microbulbifer hydrolyticus]
MILISVARVPLYCQYRRHEKDIAHCERWGLYFAAMAALQGSLYGVAWFAFVPGGDQFFLSVVCLWVMGLSACAVVGYAAHPKTLLSFFAPVVVPGTVLLLMDGSERMQILAAALFLYGVVILLAAAPVYRSIVQSIELNLRLRELSEKDGLTGLANRRHFDETLQKELDRALRNEQPLSLLLLDIDHFKAYNDHYGHVSGDHCLRLVSDAIAGCVRRSGELLARYGGEEFALLLPNTDKTQLAATVERLQAAIRESAIPHAGRPDRLEQITVSIGGTTVERDYPANPESLIENADTALYMAKNHGRNQYYFYCRRSGQLAAEEPLAVAIA